jgi:peptidoglycan/LPS O-acetylase OafA/YrhL
MYPPANYTSNSATPRRRISTSGSWSAGLEDKDSNSFDVIRLILASLVLLEHSFFLLENSTASDPLSRLTGGQFNCGNFAVCLFFAISGFLVTRSYVLTANPGRYLAKRLARIVPGFLMASLLGYAVLGYFTADDPQTFFGNQSWLPLIAQILSLHQVTMNGVLQGNAVPLVHGTLWTIKYEFDCYLLVAIFGAIGLLVPRRAWIAYLTVFAGLGAAQAGFFRLPVIDHGFVALLISSPEQWPFLFLFFFTGSALYVYRAHVPKSPLVCFAAAGVVLVTAVTGRMYWAFLVCGTYAVCYLALSTGVNLRLFGRRVDLSYGTYLYGWPVAQLLLYVTGQQFTPWLLFAASLPLTFLVAFLSWWLVEYPALRLVRRGHA